MSELKPKVLPEWPGKQKTGISIKIYVVTGVHGIIKIPESYCKECNLFVNAAKKAVEDLEEPVNIEVRSYWGRFLYPLLKGGTHPPVMMIDGEIIAQGYDVPDEKRIKQKINELREN